ncbi:MAG: pyridoxal phosphate-dependent aminotransferase [Gaiella sp.]
MTGGRFPTHEAEERLQAARERGVESVRLHGTPAPPLPGHVVEAVAAALARMTPAPPPRGLSELRSLLAEVVGRTGRAVDPEHELVVTNGAMHALALVFRALLEPGDEVVVPAPCFFFSGPILAPGGRPVYVGSTAEQGWGWDPAAIERAVGPRTKALLLCNPGNPTGHVPGPEEVEAVAAVARRHDIVLVADEAYEASLWEATLHSAFPLVEQALLVRSLGKSLSMPHLRLGLVAGPRPLVDRVATALEWDVLRVGVAPQAAAVAILEGPQEWLREVHATLAADREAALAAVDGRLAVVPPRGGPFLFVSSGEDGLGDALVEAGLPVVDGRHFQAPGWARLPVGGASSEADALERALDASFPRRTA